MFASADSLQASNPVRLIALLIALLLIIGCATRARVQLPEIDSWETRTRVLGALRDWQFSGRIAVSAGDDGFNGKMRWVQDQEAFSATVSGPLGAGKVRIEGDGRSVTLTDKDGVRTRLRDAEADLQFRYGWTIPIASLRYWALGIPDPRVPAETEFDDDGQLVTLTQRDWTVRISRYRSGGGQAMPNLLSAHNSATRVRIVIDRWQFFD